jgi:hypothetical protein
VSACQTYSIAWYSDGRLDLFCGFGYSAVFYYVGFPQIGRLVAAPRISSLKSDTRFENLPGFVGSRFYLGIVLEHLHALLNSHFFYSLVDGSKRNSIRLMIQDTDFGIQASASRLQGPVGDVLAGSIYPGVFQWLTLGPSSRDSLLLGKGSPVSNCPKTRQTDS